MNATRCCHGPLSHSLSRIRSLESIPSQPLSGPPQRVPARPSQAPGAWRLRGRQALASRLTIGSEGQGRLIALDGQVRLSGLGGRLAEAAPRLRVGGILQDRLQQPLDPLTSLLDQVAPILRPARLAPSGRGLPGSSRAARGRLSRSVPARRHARPRPARPADGPGAVAAGPGGSGPRGGRERSRATAEGTVRHPGPGRVPGRPRRRAPRPGDHRAARPGRHSGSARRLRGGGT